MSLIDTLIGQLAPYDCIACGAEGSLFCVACSSQLPSVCSQPYSSAMLSHIQACTPYQGAAKDLVWRLKSNGVQAAAKQMAELMARKLYFPSEHLLVPVPTATSRVRQRGYDQAKLLARQLARQTHLPYVNCLARLGHVHQVGANRAQRLQQMSGSFRVRRPQSVRGASIILVDDVVTTGATLESAAVVLLRAGAYRVEAATFCAALL